jgi:enolase
MKIQSINSRVILNSQGSKAVECTVVLDSGESGTFAPPAGTSTGKYEAHAVGAEIANEQIKAVSTKLIAISNPDQKLLDEVLTRKEDLGANSSLAISIAYAIAADTLNTEKRLNLKDVQGSTFDMPKMMVLFFEGGVHASGKIGIQEFMAIYSDIFKAAEDFKKIETDLVDKGHFINAGMEGAMVSDKLTEKKAFEILNGKDIALDIGGEYLKDSETDILTLPQKYSIVSIEDPYSEDDVESWKKIYKKWGNKIMIVGDDLTVTNKNRIKKFANNAINAVIIKPNQQRVLQDAFDALDVCKQEGLKTIISHRSGETNQTFVSDLAITANADFVKFGAPIRGERVAKYNRILELARRHNV